VTNNSSELTCNTVYWSHDMLQQIRRQNNATRSGTDWEADII